MKIQILTLIASLLTVPAFAETTNETEVSIVAIAGNAVGTTYSGKQATSYKLDENKFGLSGRYQQVFATPPAALTRESQETARNWQIALRYEREISEKFSLIAQQSVESDVFAGFYQRYNTDIGPKYQIVKNDTTDWVSELGYRYTSEFRTVPSGAPLTTDFRSNFARLYTKASYKFSEGVSGDLWAEYLPNFTKSDDWMLNAEAAITAQLSSTFSLKTAYLARHRNFRLPNAIANTDSSFTTAIVAKY